MKRAFTPCRKCGAARTEADRRQRLLCGPCFAGLPAKQQRRPNPELAARAERMAELYRGGMTLQQIGDAYSISRERVRQVLAKQGLAAPDGGLSKSAARRKEGKRAKARALREMKALRAFGCTLAEIEAINNGLSPYNKGSKTWRFINQRKTAAHRGIEWHLTFTEWWSVWEPYWSGRGRTRDAFVMARKQDLGPYALWNVHITTLAQNVVDYQRELKARGVVCPDGYRRLPERAAAILRGNA